MLLKIIVVANYPALHRSEQHDTVRTTCFYVLEQDLISKEQENDVDSNF